MPKITPWRKRAATLARRLKTMRKSLDGVLVEASQIKGAAEVESKHGGDRYPVRISNIEQEADRLISTLSRLVEVVTFKSDRELHSRAIDTAQRVCRNDYWNDVRGVADEFCVKWNSGDFDSRDQAIEWMDQSVSGHGRIIYTSAAQECLLYSGNDGAYIDNYGTDGVVSDGSINWSQLAFSAMRADVMEQISDNGVNVNENPPEKVTDHEFQGDSDDYCEHPVDDDEDPDGEQCGKPKQLHQE